MNDKPNAFEQTLVPRGAKVLIAISDGVAKLDSSPIPKVGETVKVAEQDGHDINMKVEHVEGENITGTIISSCKYDLLGLKATFHAGFIQQRDNSGASNFN